MARPPFFDEEGAKLVPEIKEKAAETDAELTLLRISLAHPSSVRTVKSRNMTRALAYQRALAFLRAFLATLTRQLVPPC